MNLIPVSKGVEYLEVHPTTLAAHREQGWRECAKRDLEADPEGAKKAVDMKVDELKAALTSKGVAIPEGAKKPDLVALLEASGDGQA